VIWLLASAVAAELLVWVPGGSVEQGARSQVGVWCRDCGEPLAPADLRVSGAAVLSARPSEFGAVVLELGPPEGRSIQVSAPSRAGAPSAALSVVTPALPAVELSLPGDISLGDDRVVILLHAPDALGPDDLALQFSEGIPSPVRATADGYAVSLQLGAERGARPLLVSAGLRSRPAAPPAFAAARVRARINANVAAEPGSVITIRLGGRAYGPFTAGAGGAAQIAFDALPGESTYELAVADDLGNTQRLVQNIPASQRPVMLASPVVSGGGGELWLAATDARGAAWTGAAPTCRSGAGVAEEPAPLDRGRWRWSTTNLGSVVGCSLGETTLTLRPPPPLAAPSAIQLKVYPEVLSADFPLAEVQVSLVDAAGERLPPEGLSLTATHGILTGEAGGGGALRFAYDGRAAAALGADELRARWSPPAGSGPPSRVTLCTAKGQAGTVAVARVLDGRGLPIPDAPVALSAGKTALPAQVTDARGFARGLLPAGGTVRVRAESARAAAEVLAFDSAPGDARCISGADPGRADLEVALDLPIRTGRVRQVFLQPEPSTLTLGPGATAQLRVRMLDAAGALVRDEPVRLETSEGVVGAPTLQPDGSLLATFTPAPDTNARDVRISATTSAGTVSTTLAVAPRPVRGLVWAGAGWTSNFGAMSGPFGSLGFEHRLPLPGVSVRGAVGLYGVEQTVADGEGQVHAEGTFFPIEIGATITDRGPRLSLGAGLGLAIVPYTLTATFDDGEQVGGGGLALPGVDVHGTAGWRLGQTELFAELAYLLYLAPEGAVTVAGNAGGLRVIAGYRLLY
jgi:hypothetical protein